MSSGESGSAQTYRELVQQYRTPVEHAQIYDGSGTWKEEYMPSSGDESLADTSASVRTLTLLGEVSVSSDIDYPHSA